jgi:hypothetical protein
MSYIGAQPTTGSFPFDQFSGNGSTTAFTLTYAPASTTSIIVAVSGVVQNPSTYSVSSTTLTFTGAPPSGTNNISVLYLGLPVQIGTPIPGSTLQLALGSAANPSLTFIGDTNTGIYSPGADTIVFVEGGVEAMRIDSSANVGIGTSSPDFQFQVEKPSTSTFVSVVSGTANTAGILLGDTDSATIGRVEYDNAGNFMSLYTNGSERARIDSSGNVGIGTTTPSNKLQVSSGGADVARFTNTLSNGGDWQFKIGGGGFEDRKLMITDRFGGADNVRLSIDSSGNVAVTGTVTGTNLFGQSQTWTNVTGSRATGTTYTNSTGRSIMVVVTPVASGGLIGTFNISGSAVGVVQFTPSGGGGGSPFFYIIPNGVKYSVTNNANFNISYWWELR